LKAKFSDGNISLEAVGFGLGHMASQLAYDRSYDLAYELGANEWNGFEMAQLSLVDIRGRKEGEGL
jgi:single-stranded-DNA-specific exonuclease